jgi:hypothetical protein
VTLTANGVAQQVTLPTTADWNTWAVSSTTVTLPASSSALSVSCGSADSCNVNFDSLAVTTVGAAYPTPAAPPADNNLGGYRRSLDGQSGAAPLADGVLSRDGWYLLDDTNTGLLNSDGSVTPRPGHNGQEYQDGYFFGYGHNYKQGLKDLRDLTGPAVMLPHSAYGVWYSRYYPYSLSDYQNTLIPAFRTNKTPIDTLVADTDWKSPNQWDGWEWNRPEGILHLGRRPETATGAQHPSVHHPAGLAVCRHFGDRRRDAGRRKLLNTVQGLQLPRPQASPGLLQPAFGHRSAVRQARVVAGPEQH